MKLFRLADKLQITCERAAANCIDPQNKKIFTNQINANKRHATKDQENELNKLDPKIKTIFVENDIAYTNGSYNESIPNFNTKLFCNDSFFEIQL